MGFLTVSEVARRLNAKPKDISDAFYARKLDDRRCLIVGGRRLTSEEYLPELEQVLRDLGLLEVSCER